MPVNGGILIYVPHFILWTPYWAPIVGGKPEGQHGGPKQECQEELQSYIWHQNQVINIESGSMTVFEFLLGTLVEVPHVVSLVVHLL